MITKRLQQRRRQSGITLTEVLVSIGVAGVGMFGVFVLIPFCARQAELGQVYDLGSATAKSAVSTIEIQGIADPEVWVRTPAGTSGTDFPLNVTDTPDSTDADAEEDWKQNSYCIDPLMLGVAPDRFMFPAGATRNAGTRCIERITLTGITQSIADLVFRGSDDIVLVDGDAGANASGDKQIMPGQLYETALDVSGTTIVDGIARSSKGDISWLAMIEPQPGVFDSDFYRLYVVVFKNRRLDGASPEERVFEPNANPLLSEVEMTGGGEGGGDLTLKRLAVVDFAEFSLRRNNWVVFQSTIAGSENIFAWYRVVRADQNPDGDPLGTPADVPETYVTVEGGDWPTATLGNPRVIFIPEVVTVFEKTVKLGTELFR